MGGWRATHGTGNVGHCAPLCGDMEPGDEREAPTRAACTWLMRVCQAFASRRTVPSPNPPEPGFAPATLGFLSPHHATQSSLPSGSSISRWLGPLRPGCDPRHESVLAEISAYDGTLQEWRHIGRSVATRPTRMGRSPPARDRDVSGGGSRRGGPVRRDVHGRPPERPARAQPTPTSSRRLGCAQPQPAQRG